MIVPAVVAFNGGDAQLLIQGKAGPGRCLGCCPRYLNPSRWDVGALFFLFIFAALTSSISLLETVVSIPHG